MANTGLSANVLPNLRLDFMVGVCEALMLALLRGFFSQRIHGSADDSLVGSACHRSILSKSRLFGTEYDKVDQHCDSHDRQEQGQREGERRGMGLARSAGIEPPDERDVAPGRQHVDQNAGSDERGAEPERQARRLESRHVLGQQQLLQVQPEASDNEPEAHERQGRPNPCKQRAFGRERIAQVAAHNRSSGRIN